MIQALMKFVDIVKTDNRNATRMHIIVFVTQDISSPFFFSSR